jgi:hypothetical protein
VCAAAATGCSTEIAAGLSALVAFVLALYQVQLLGTGPWSIGAPIAALFVFNAWWIKHLRREPEDRLISARSMAFAVPALILLGNVVWQITPEATRPAAFAILALACLPAFRVRLAEVGLTAQLFVPFGRFAGIFSEHDILSRIHGGRSPSSHSPPSPWCISGSFVAKSLGKTRASRCSLPLRLSPLPQAFVG